MLGTFRLCLALLVALSHIGVDVFGLNPGVPAVVGFYLISGYVMTGLIRSHYATASRAWKFYVDRLMRLVPHYLVIAAITLGWFLAANTYTLYLATSPTPARILQNVLIVPMNYYMFNHSDQFALIPPSWSLGAEIQFYLVAPLLLLPFETRLRFVALAGSLLVYAVASFGFINSDWYGYRLLSGVLFMFVLGSIFHDLHHRRNGTLLSWLLVLAIGALVVLLASMLVKFGKLHLNYDRETLLGLAVGSLAVNILAPRARNRFDDMLGNLSYGVFLNQFLVQWVFFDGEVRGVVSTIGYLAISIVIAAIMFRFVERPVLKLRRRFRTVRQNNSPAGSQLLQRTVTPNGRGGGPAR